MTGVRAGLVFLAVVQGLAGVVQLFLPQVFYDDFPGVSLLPPYSEHLMRDVGALTLAYVLMLTVAAVSLERRMVLTALGANLVFTVPHFVFHAAHLEHFSTGGAIGQTVVLGLAVVIPALLMIPAGKLPRAVS
jgi:hypothetical protein